MTIWKQYIELHTKFLTKFLELTKLFHLICLLLVTVKLSFILLVHFLIFKDNGRAIQFVCPKSCSMPYMQMWKVSSGGQDRNSCGWKI